MNNQDLKSIINTACKYEDTEVLEKIASSKRIQTAGVRDLLKGLGLQVSQTANESQFKNQRELTTFIRFAGSVDDREAAKDILEWWTNKIKEIGSDSITIDVDEADPKANAKGIYVKQIDFTPKNCVQLNSLKIIYDSLPPNDLNKIYGIDPTTVGSSPQPFINKDDPPTLFDQSSVNSSNNQPITFNKVSPVNLGVYFIKISNAGGDPGFLDFLSKNLNSVNPPKLSDNIHVKIFDLLNSHMSDKAMSSMIRKNALAETPRAGLISNWNYIVNLPKEIESRMAKTPKTIMDYKQKLALKGYGRSLSQILNTRIKFQNYVPSSRSSSAEGLKTEIPFYKINELSSGYFMDPDVQLQIKPLMERTGELLNVIIPELDKDTSLTRKIIKNLITPSDYLNTRGKEFH